MTKKNIKNKKEEKKLKRERSIRMRSSNENFIRNRRRRRRRRKRRRVSRTEISLLLLLLGSGIEFQLAEYTESGHMRTGRSEMNGMSGRKGMQLYDKEQLNGTHWYYLIRTDKLQRS